jgi:hypothetical protein
MLTNITATQYRLVRFIRPDIYCAFNNVVTFSMLTSKWTSQTIFENGRGGGYITFGVGFHLLGALLCSFITEDATGNSKPFNSSPFEL